MQNKGGHKVPGKPGLHFLKDVHVDTSPYAYNGLPTNMNDPYAYAGVEDPYAFVGGCVDQYTDDEVADFNNCNSKRVQIVDNPDFGTYDSLFGLGKNRQKKKAEKKLKKAEEKIAAGNTKAGNRKLAKAEKILGKISASQSAAGAAQQQLADINASQQQLTTNSALLSSIAANNPGGVQPLSSQPMSDIAQAQPIPESGTGMTSPVDDLTGIESTAPDNSVTTSDEPTGDLATTKTLPNVTVTAGKASTMTIIIVLIVAVAIIGGIVYFSKHKGKMKL